MSAAETKASVTATSPARGDDEEDEGERVTTDLSRRCRVLVGQRFMEFRAAGYRCVAGEERVSSLISGVDGGCHDCSTRYGGIIAQGEARIWNLRRSSRRARASDGTGDQDRGRKARKAYWYPW